jgi:hypothetical protein
VLEILRGAREFQLKVACLELLRQHQYAEAVPVIAALLKDGEALSTRIAACRALGLMRRKEAIPPLVAGLRGLTSGRLRYEVTAALRALTGQSLAELAAPWEEWWTRNQANFAPPPPAATAFNYELVLDPQEDLAYYEIPVVEDRIVFVIDTSGSMSWGGKPNRLDKAREELKNLVGRLHERVLFNIILFSSGVRRWQKLPLVPATPGNKLAARAFLDKAQAVGGTWTMDALEEALWEIAVPNGVETIYLLTDGAPNFMAHSPFTRQDELPKSNDQIRRRIRFLNQVLKVRINAIGIYTQTAKSPEEPPVTREAMKAFLEKVAAENDGVYKEVP